MRPPATLSLLAGQALAYTTSNAGSSLTLLYQNNLNFTEDVTHAPALLLDPVAVARAQQACAVLNETLLSQATVQQHQSDFLDSLHYLSYKGVHPSNQTYLLSKSITVTAEPSGLIFAKAATDAVLPLLCTQSSLSTAMSSPLVDPASRVSLTAFNDNTFVGYRNLKSFRFLGIPYADKPARWTHSRVYSKTAQVFDAAQYGAKCPQINAESSSEDCLFLNIQTPFIPRAGFAGNPQTRKLPVLFWIHGGGYTSGSSLDAASDGGDIASREDVVVVTINYRLNALGFFAVPDQLSGNFGIGDQVTALRWVRQNIAAFGGDPQRITIAGDSAGGASVRVLVGSPVAHPLFQQAWVVSSPGGGDSFNRNINSHTYSSYSTIAEAYNAAGHQLFQQAGCSQTTVAAQIDCLRQAPAQSLAALPAAGASARVVQDKYFVTTPRLDVSGSNNNTGRIPIVIGGAHNDGASFSDYPSSNVANLTEGLEIALSISTAQAQRIVDSGVFPYYETGNKTSDIFNVTQRIVTDESFRCEAQATLYSGVSSGAFERGYFYDERRTWAGYDPEGVGGERLPGAAVPYYNLHSGGSPNFFAHPPEIRGDDELKSLRYSMSRFASFIRSGDPQPAAQYLTARGYDDVLQAQQSSPSWTQVTSENGPVELLGSWPPVVSDFVDKRQCDFLGYSLNKYLAGG